MKYSDRKTIFALTLAIALSVAFLIILTSPPSDGDDSRPAVTLFDRNGNEYSGAILDGFSVGVDTYYEDGVRTYIVPEGTAFDTNGTYIRIQSELDSTVSVGIPELSGWLASVGMTVTLYTDDALQTPKAQTTLDGTYRTGVFDGDLDSGVNYYIGIKTAGEYSSEVRPGAVTLNDIEFSITTANIVVFVSDGRTVDTRTLDDDDPLGDLPVVSKTGYRLKGWYSGNLRVSSTTLVSELPSMTVKAEWEHSEPPDVWPKIFEEDEYKDNMHIHTTTYLYKDGFKKVIITITYTDSDDLDRYVRYYYTSGKVEEISMHGHGDRIEITIPSMTVRFIEEAEESIRDLDYNTVIITTPFKGRLSIPDTATGTLERFGYWVSVHGEGMYAMLDSDAVRYLDSLERDSTFTISKPTPGSVTSEQLDAIGDNFAAVIELWCGGERISDFRGSSEIGLSPGYRIAGVYHVAADGAKETLDYNYDAKAGTAVFTVDHYSVYMAERVADSDDDSYIWIYVIIGAIAVGLLLTFAIRRRRR